MPNHKQMDLACASSLITDNRMDRPPGHKLRSTTRSRGKSKYTMVEDDDDSIDIVTFDTVLKDTPGGPSTTRIEVPLRPITVSNPEAQPEPSSRLPFQENVDFPMGDARSGGAEEYERVHVNKVCANDYTSIMNS